MLQLQSDFNPMTEKKFSAEDRLHMKRYLGFEPMLDPDDSRSSLSSAYGWYNYFCTYDDAKAYAISYAENHGYSKEFIAKLNKSKSHHFAPLGWTLRLANNGSFVPPKILNRALKKLDALGDITYQQESVFAQEGETSPTPAVSKSNEYFTQVAGDLEEALDKFLVNYKSDFDPAEYLKAKGLKPASLKKIISIYSPLASEYAEAAKGRDPDLNEAYKHVKKSQLISLASFVQKIVAASEQLLYIKQASRKPRVKKIKTAEQIAKKVKFKATDERYGLVSLDPSAIVGASQVWVFDTAKRFLGVYHAENETTPLSLKGTTVQGFDAEKSVSKKLRKPEQTIPLVKSEGKVGLRKVLATIRAKEKKLNGRLNSNVVIVRVVK